MKHQFHVQEPTRHQLYALPLFPFGTVLCKRFLWSKTTLVASQLPRRTESNNTFTESYNTNLEVRFFALSLDEKALPRLDDFDGHHNKHDEIGRPVPVAGLTISHASIKLPSIIE